MARRRDWIDTTVNRQCIFINPDTNEIMVNNLDAWRYVSSISASDACRKTVCFP